MMNTLLLCRSLRLYPKEKDKYIMPKSNESINRELFDLLSTRGYRPTMLDTSGKEIPVPEEAEVFQFNFVKDEVDYGIVTISIDGLHKLVIYFNDKIADSEKETSDNDDVSWYRLLNHLKRFAKNRQLSFQVKNTDHLKHDMAKRDHMKKLDEGYYPMGKNKSYSDAVPQVKIVIEHTRNIVEGEQRYRNVARIFVENADGERFLIPTTKPGIARVYARHIAEGGTPYDDRANHITSLVEDYNKMSGFVRATRNGQFNESAQRLVLEGIDHYTKLRETLSHMAGRRGYTSYFENWTPSLMEDEAEETNLNELFVQETLDPRIESVLPILSKLNKKISEMSEVTELADWADKLLEGGDGGEASEEPPESKEGETAEDGNEAPADDLEEGIIDTVKKVGGKVLDKLGHGSDEYLLKDLKDKAGVRNPQTGKPSMAHSDVEKRVKEEVDTGQYDAVKSSPKGGNDRDWDKPFREKIKQYAKELEKRQKEKEQGVAEGATPASTSKILRLIQRHHSDWLDTYGIGEVEDAVVDMAEMGQFQGMSAEDAVALVAQELDSLYGAQGMAEGLDTNQKRVGQLGPTSRVKNNNIGKLVGANENFINQDDQAVVTEEEQEDKKSDSPEYMTDKNGKTVPVNPKKDGYQIRAEKKKEVKEGQEDLDTIRRLLGK
jgi:hypothetical protein